MTISISTELSRKQLLLIVEILNKKHNMSIARVSRLDDRRLQSIFAKYEDQSIEIGASLGFGPCFANQSQPDSIKRTSNGIGPKKVGIINAIVDFLIKRGDKPFRRDEVHAYLVKTFPDRDANSMMSTVRAQIPHHLGKNRGFKFVKLSDHRLQLVLSSVNSAK